MTSTGTVLEQGRRFYANPTHHATVRPFQAWSTAIIAVFSIANYGTSELIRGSARHMDVLAFFNPALAGLKNGAK